MMNKTKLLISSAIIIFFLLIAFVIIKSYNYSKIPFINTTGFYFDGINANDPSFINAYGLYNPHNSKTTLHCFQQYRTSDEYIYLDWRADLKFNYKANVLILQMPDSIWNKINTVWFKNGNNVIKYSSEEMLSEWEHQVQDGVISFKSTEKQVNRNSFTDGVHLFINTTTIFGISCKCYTLLGLLFLALIFICYFRKPINDFCTLLLSRIKLILLKHKSFYSKVFAVFIGIFTLLIILELALRIIGYVHEHQNIDKNYSLAENTDNVIICLGDSFTDGIGASKGNDYPSVLDKLIKNEYCNKYQTLNFGQSGKNTTQIKDEFINYTQKNTPEMVIMMAGSANYWNYYGFEDKGKLIYSIKTFKLIKLLYNNIFNNQSELHSNHNEKNVFNEQYYKRRQEFKNRTDSIVTNDSTSNFAKYVKTQLPINNYIDSIFNTGYINENELRDLIFYAVLTNTKIKIPEIVYNNISPDILQLLGVYKIMVGEYCSLDNFSSEYYKALYYYVQSFNYKDYSKINYLLLTIKEFPYFEDAYYELYSSTHFTPALPQDFEQKAFCIKDTLNFYKSKFGFSDNKISVINSVNINESLTLDIKTSKINYWIDNDLEDIIIQCRKKGIKLMLMTYPYQYEENLFQPVNGIIENLSKKYSITLINNYSNFKKAGNPKKYYVADSHCSDLGYSIIAESIFTEIVKKDILIDNQ